MICPVVPDQESYTFHYRWTTKRVEERTNDQIWTWVSSKHKKGESVLHFSRICRLSQACILRETWSKPLRNGNSNLTVFSHCLLLWPSFPWTAIWSWPSTSALLYQLALSVFSQTFLPSSTFGLAGDLVLSRLSGFRAKTDKEIVWVAPTQTETNCYASCHTL